MRKIEGRERFEEIARGRRWVRSMSASELADLGDQFVLGEFDWREWLSRKPSSWFLRGADDERILIESEVS